MAGKKVPTVEDALNYFKEVMKRSSLQNYVYVNNLMLSKTPKNQSVIIAPELELWRAIIDDKDLRENMKELNPDNAMDRYSMQLLTCGEDLTTAWIDLDSIAIYNGVMLKVSIDGLEYDIPINKNLLPLKIKKAEADNIAYKVFVNPNMILAVKKKFIFPVEECNFTIMRLLQIL